MAGKNYTLQELLKGSLLKQDAIHEICFKPNSQPFSELGFHVTGTLSYEIAEWENLLKGDFESVQFLKIAVATSEKLGTIYNGLKVTLDPKDVMSFK